MYHTTRHRVYIIKNENRQDEDQDEDQDLSLIAGVTENKCQADSDPVGQLLGEMEKVAGDLAYKNLQDGDLSEEEKVFRYIELFALTIDFEQGMCQVYKLKMDFLATCSTLYIGDKKLYLNEGVNRLFEALEKD